ncbi:hypothetical protein GGI20_003812 [Coemansia sp. BCRC 34301]|nr:hypothetical protein GGI20_003812 [Coemansia sp. BCRC 34301]
MNGASSRGAPGWGGRRGKSWQPSHGGVPVVPRILMRPERAAAQASNESSAAGPAPVVVLARPSAPPIQVAASPPPPLLSPTPPPLPQQTSAEACVVAGIPAYRDIVDQPRSSRITILTPEGRLLDGMVRKHLAHLECRSCIGVLGRPSSGKSMLLSRLASLEPADLFPPAAAAAEHRIGTLGVELWVTPARIILVDAPPVVSVMSAPERARLVGDPRGPPSLPVARARDLQLAILLIRVSSVLLVFADPGSGLVDKALAKLLVDARELLDQFPGPRHHPNTHSQAERECKLYIVVNRGAAGNLDAMARAYEVATGFAVCGVSVVPDRCLQSMRMPGVAQTMGPRFLRVAESWAADPALPLYPLPPDLSRSGDQGRRSLLCWPQLPTISADDQLLPVQRTFEEAVDDLRARLLAPPPVTGWGEMPAGEWVNTCLKVWDAIRRSHKLRDSASQFQN